MNEWRDVAAAIQAHPAGAWLHQHLSRPPKDAERVRLRVGATTLPGGGAYILVPPAVDGAWHLELSACLEVAGVVIREGRPGVQLRLEFDQGKSALRVAAPTFTIPADAGAGGQVLSIGDLSGAVAPVLPAMPQLPGVMPPEYVMALEQRRMDIEERGRQHAFTVTGLQVAREELSDEREHMRELLRLQADAHARDRAELMKAFTGLLDINRQLSMGQAGGVQAAWAKTVEALQGSADARVAAARAEAEAAAAGMAEGEAVQLAAIDAATKAIPVLGMVLSRALPKRGEAKKKKDEEEAKKGEKKEEPKKEEGQGQGQAPGEPPPPPATEGAPAAEEAPAAPGDLLGPLLLLLLDEAHEEHQAVREEFRAALGRLSLPQLMAVGQRIQALAMEGRS